MKPEAGGSWFFLVIERLDKKNLILDGDELSSIPLAVISTLTSKMKLEGLEPIANESGAWTALGFHEDFWPYTVPPSVCELAKYIPSGTVVTLDNGCLPSIEWRFGKGGVEVFDSSDH
jgi:hypothetical protein